jgi:hypothetical protein
LFLYSLFINKKKDYNKKIIIAEETLDYDRHIHQIRNVSTLNVKKEKNHRLLHLFYMLIAILFFLFIIITLINANKHIYIKNLIIIEVSLVLMFILSCIFYVINKDESIVILTLNSGKQYFILTKREKIADFLKLSINQKIEKKTTDIIEIELLSGNYTKKNAFGMVSNHVI